jgi:hypothetical protein
MMDIVERLNHAIEWHRGKDTILLKNSRDEIEQLQKNAEQDAKYLLAYHLICQKHGIAPSSSDLLEALGEKE